MIKWTKRWIAKIKNRRDYWKVGKAFLYLFGDIDDYRTEDTSDALDILIRAMEQLDEEYNNL